jgi:tetratricopeptide (TPR) repeat protein
VTLMAALQKIDTLLKVRRFKEAAPLAAQLIQAYPDSAEGWQRQGYLQEVTGDFNGMLGTYKKLQILQPDDLQIQMKAVQTTIQCGHVAKAVDALKTLAEKARNSPDLLQQIAQLYTSLSLFEQAHICYGAAVKLAPQDMQALYNLASAATAVGEIAQSERLFDQVIALKPSDYDAYYNRSTLKKQTETCNHIAQMEGLLKAGIPDHKGAVQLFYALAKEYEDLGESSSSFAHLTRGANLRASMMSYDVAGDEATMAKIIATFNRSFVENIPQSTEEKGPIFIVGLPRSGTTLVDRILSSHSQVTSLGEINDFALNLVKHAGPTDTKEQLVERSSQLDFEALGADYRKSTAERGTGAAYLVDKTPANFLYLGLIARALPNAKIIHLRRGAMDSCYAIYKTLFRMGYPYSYRQEDLARYYSAYHRLMAHWRSLMPTRFIDLDYESLVLDQEAETRRLLAHCGLDFEKACLAFHENKSPSATASAAQVRLPIYQGSVGKWRQYAHQLSPLRSALIALGISVEEA